MSNKYIDNIDSIKTIINHQMASQLYKYVDYDFQHMIDNNLLIPILSTFSEHTINYIIKNSIVNKENYKIIFTIFNNCHFVNCLKEILNKYDINIMNNENKTLLYVICNKGFKNYEMIQYLITNNINFKQLTKHKKTAFDILYKYCFKPVDLDIFKLFENIYDLKNNNYYEIFSNLTKSKENGETLLYMIDNYDIDINKINNNKNLFTNIIYTHNIEIIKKVIEKYDCINYNYSDYFNKHLSIVIAKRFHYDIEIIKYFLNLGISPIFTKYQNMLTVVTKYSKNYQVIKFIINIYEEKAIYKPCLYIYNLTINLDNADRYKGLIYILQQKSNILTLKQKENYIKYIKRNGLKHKDEIVLINLINQISTNNVLDYIALFIFVVVFVILSYLSLILV